MVITRVVNIAPPKENLLARSQCYAGQDRGSKDRAVRRVITIQSDSGGAGGGGVEAQRAKRRPAAVWLSRNVNRAGERRGTDLVTEGQGLDGSIASIAPLFASVRDSDAAYRVSRIVL